MNYSIKNFIIISFLCSVFIQASDLASKLLYFNRRVAHRTIKVHEPLRNVYIRTVRRNSTGHRWDVIGFRKLACQMNDLPTGSKIEVRRDTGKRLGDDKGLNGLIDLAFLLNEEHEGYGRAYIPGALNAMPFDLYINDDCVARIEGLYKDSKAKQLGELAFVLEKEF